MTQHLDNFKARPVACVTGATRGIGRDIAPTSSSARV